MAISFSQLTQLFIEFIENNFVSLLSTVNYSHKQALLNWEQFKTHIQVQNIQRWKLEDFIKNTSMLSTKANCTLPDTFLNQSYPSKNIGSTIDSGSFSSFYINQKWDKTKKENSKAHSLENVTDLSFLNSPSTRLQTNLSFIRDERHVNKEEKQRQSIETLLVSFNKLCTNFENNHKKLMRDGFSSRYS